MGWLTWRKDPAPSRWSYKLQRILLTPAYRNLLRYGLPLGAIIGTAAWYLNDPAVREQIGMTITDMREQIKTRPEFMVNEMMIAGAGEDITDKIRALFPYELPASSFDMDLVAVRSSVLELAAVSSATVRVRKGSILEIEVSEREPAALIRVPRGLKVVDSGGVPFAAVASRTEHPSLPVLTGMGAEDAVSEALAIRDAVEPLRSRFRGLVRIGERRWDVVLDRDQRIYLPEFESVGALEWVIVLSQAKDMLERDIAVVDMRMLDRPTLRVRARAEDEQDNE